MKRILLLTIVLTSLLLNATAQDANRIFKRFKGDVSFGYAIPAVSGGGGGILFAMEPKIAVIDQLAVGMRIEGAVMARFTGNRYSGIEDIDDARLAASYVSTADYYFTNNYSFRPFAGIGAGVFALNTDAVPNSESVSFVKFGGLIRIGAEVKHFRFGFELNLVPKTDYTAYEYDNNTGDYLPQNVRVTNAYFGIKAGVCFGGGPLRRMKAK